MVSSTEFLFSLIDGSGNQYSMTALGTTAQAANTYITLSKNQQALSTDPVDLKINKSVRIVDLVANNTAGTPTGVIRLMIDGDEKPVFLNLASHKLDNAGRPKLNILLPGGSTIRWKITTAISAG